MLSPTRNLAGNLRWTRSGRVWADWLLSPIPYGYRPKKDKDVVRTLHRGLLRALPGESLLMGLCVGLDPSAIVERMMGGVDMADHPDWAAECAATLDTLDALGPGERVYWLSVPLGNMTVSDRLLEPVKSAFADLSDMVGFPRGGPSPEDISRRLRQARKVAEGIPSPFKPQPATVAQMVWLHLHAQQRGLALDLDLPSGADGGDVTGDLLLARSAAAMGEAILDEGGKTDLTRREQLTFNPSGRRFLKVIQPDQVEDQPASYQSLLVLTDVPAGGMRFPGSEFLGRIDESGIDVDWATRTSMRSSEQAQAANQRALRSLNEQYSQREGELSHGLGILDRAASELSEYAATLDSDKHEVELQVTTIFCVAGPTPDDAAKKARALADYVADADYKLSQPLGYQEQLWWAMTPGSPATRAVSEFAQITTSRSLSAAIPLASAALGDRKGSLLGLNISTGLTGVVLHDPAGASARDVSGSLGIAGELGSGKSLTLKKLAGDVVDLGGRLVIPDRTQTGEWATWAQSVVSSTVVDPADPRHSIDPLRLFGPRDGALVAQSFLTPLLNIAPTSERGVLLAEVLEEEYLTTHAITGLGVLRRHLAEDCTLPGAPELARLMNVFARRDICRVIFDPALPILDVAASRAIIVRTHAVQLPTRDEINHEHLFKQLRPEKLFGRALYALIAGFARRICFADPTELGVFSVDECEHVTSSPEGEIFMVEFVRDGRKNRAAVFMGGHDPEGDFGSPTLRGLIPTRLAMRHRDETLAKRSLAWIGLDPEDEALLTMYREDTSPVGPDGVAEHRRGEGFLRDSSGNIGRVKVLAPAVAARNVAARTTPPEQAEAFTAAAGDDA